MKSRIEFIDIARGIAIICIVLGHMGVHNINAFVFTFHVPIFYFITGYFLKGDAPAGAFFRGKFKALIVPYFCTCLVIIALSMVVNEVFLGGEETKKLGLKWVYASLYGAGDSYEEPFYIKGIGAIWFLWATFWGTGFLNILLKFKKPLYRLLGVLALFAAGYWLREICWFPLSIQAGACSVLFMYFGHLFRSLKAPLQSLSLEVKAALTLLALGVWICFIRDFQSFWLVHCDIGRGVVDIGGCICGCYIVLLVSWFISRHCRWASRALGFMGQYSIIVLCAHIIELDVFQWNKIMNYLVAHGLPEQLSLYVKILGKFAWIVPVTFFCSRNNFMRGIFGMKKLEKA